MKKLVISSFLVLSLFGFMAISLNTADASVRVRGYTTKRGTYVAPSYRSNPDSSRYNNYSTKGNYNPYTGKKGYTDPYKYNW
ncbi:MAG: hypothetical protein NTZ44_03725 [Candidatus Nomurabacteria bacterium]|nr:hypothetical protein [Candidatus Nomurabacteria bacterium]